MSPPRGGGGGGGRGGGLPLFIDVSGGIVLKLSLSKYNEA